MKMTANSAVLFTCPACKVEVSGVVLLSAEPNVNGVAANDGRLTMEVTIAGLRVAHNCLPAHTRVRDSKPKATAKK